MDAAAPHSSSAAAPVTSLTEMMAAIEAELLREISLMDEQIEESRRARKELYGSADAELLMSGNGDGEEDLTVSSAEAEEGQEIVRQFIDLINRAADAYNASEASAAEGFSTASTEAAAVISALRDHEASLPTTSISRSTKGESAEGTRSSSTPVSQQQQAECSENNDNAENEENNNNKALLSNGDAGATDENAEQSSASASPSLTGGAPEEQMPSPIRLVKGGMLLNYGKDRFMRSFISTYVVVSDGGNTSVNPKDVAGVAWYDSESAYKKGAAPIDSIPFFVVEKNSRGSLFKKASVCWPLVTEEDCPKLSAVDKSKVYFAVDYANPKTGRMDLIVLGASSEAERDEWVTFITKFLVLYLPPGEEFEPFIDFPVGANPPLHVSQVLGGEAPGSAQRVIDPAMRR